MSDKKEVKTIQTVMTHKVSEGVKNQMKTEYGERLKSIIVPKDDLSNEFVEVLVLVPSRSVVGTFLKLNNTDPGKALDILVKNCVVTSKEEILADDGLFYTTATMIAELIPMRQGKLGKV